jgi:hypothetical protein
VVGEVSKQSQLPPLVAPTPPTATISAVSLTSTAAPNEAVALVLSPTRTTFCTNSASTHTPNTCSSVGTTGINYRICFYNHHQWFCRPRSSISSSSMTVSIASITTNVSRLPDNHPFLIDHTGSPVLIGLKEYRLAMAAHFERIDALQEELDQYPKTKSDEEAEAYCTGDFYFDFKEGERVHIRREIARLEQGNRDAIAAFNAKQNKQAPLHDSLVQSVDHSYNFNVIPARIPFSTSQVTYAFHCCSMEPFHTNIPTVSDPINLPQIDLASPSDWFTSATHIAAREATHTVTTSALRTPKYKYNQRSMGSHFGSGGHYHPGEFYQSCGNH